MGEEEGGVREAEGASTCGRVGIGLGRTGCSFQIRSPSSQADVGSRRTTSCILMMYKNTYLVIFFMWQKVFSKQETQEHSNFM